MLNRSHRAGGALRTVAALGAFASASASLHAEPLPATAVRPVATGDAWSPSDVAKLRDDLDTLLAGDPAVRGAHVGVYAVMTNSGMQLYAHNASDEFQPASTLKLLVGSVALDTLGAAYRFRTQLEQSGDRLILRVGGDPLLSSPDLAAAADAVLNAGITRASGVTIDTSHFDTPAYPNGWVWDDFSYDYAVPVSAAAVDENVHYYSAFPGQHVGDPVSILERRMPLEPRTTCPGLLNRAVTAPAAGSVTLDTLTIARDCTAVTGGLPLNTPSVSVAVAVGEPEENVRIVLSDYLIGPSQRFVLGDNAPHGESHAQSHAAGRVIWQHVSDPLGVWLGHPFWLRSDNFIAEQLLCEIGFVAAGGFGSTERGLDAERAWLRANGIDPATTTLADGSGLSQYDRITPSDLVAILQHDWNGPSRDLVLDSLPLGGVRGTIEGIAGTLAAGRVYAKTGSMSHVRGLAGYLATARHGAVTFAFNVDDWNGDYAQLAALRARVLARIVKG